MISIKTKTQLQLYYKKHKPTKNILISHYTSTDDDEIKEYIVGKLKRDFGISINKLNDIINIQNGNLNINDVDVKLLEYTNDKNIILGLIDKLREKNMSDQVGYIRATVENYIPNVKEEYILDELNEIISQDLENSTIINKSMENDIWKKYYNSVDTKCICCGINQITPFLNKLAYIIPAYKGGKVNINNIVPICSQCYDELKSKNLCDYMKNKYNRTLQQNDTIKNNVSSNNMFSNTVKPTIKKRKAIPKNIHEKVWKKYYKNVNEAKCICCDICTISSFNHEVGHIMSVSNGGNNDDNNLVPICSSCNKSMGTMNLKEYMKSTYNRDLINGEKVTPDQLFDIPSTEKILKDDIIEKVKLLDENQSSLFNRLMSEVVKK